MLDASIIDVQKRTFAIHDLAWQAHVIISHDGPKLFAVVEKDEVSTLDIDDEIELSISIDISEGQCDYRQISTRSDQ